MLQAHELRHANVYVDYCKRMMEDLTQVEFIAIYAYVVFYTYREPAKKRREMKTGEHESSTKKQ